MGVWRPSDPLDIIKVGRRAPLRPRPHERHLERKRVRYNSMSGEGRPIHNSHNSNVINVLHATACNYSKRILQPTSTVFKAHGNKHALVLKAWNESKY